MSFEYDPTGKQDPDGFKEFREEYFLSGNKLLHASEERETISAVGKLMTAQLTEKYVSAASVKSLHPEVTDEMANAVALDMSLQLVRNKLSTIFEQSSQRISWNDMRQVLSGTLTASHEALAALCLGSGCSSARILAEARARSTDL
jgi:hypothetical protein